MSFDESEQQHPKRSEGEFFGVSLSTLDRIVSLDAGASEVMAYIILARGVNARSVRRLGTHGALSIAKRTGMAYRVSEEALNWLIDKGIASKDIKNYATGQKHTHPRWILQDAIADTWLANVLTDGIGNGKNNPPLMKIYNEVGISCSGLVSNARLDASMVLIHLYYHQDMATYGGINPRAGIYGEWVAAKNVWGDKIIDIPDSNGALYEIKVNDVNVFTKFASEALFYIDDEEDRHSRFWDAFHNLETMGFIYEVISIWSTNPNGPNRKKAEPMYTLYVRDSRARKSDPYLQKEIHEAAFRTGAMDRYNEFYGWSSDDISYSNIKSGRFRYIALKNSNCYPIGIYRLRYRPKTRDTGIGIEAEKRRIMQWSQELSKLR